MGEQESPLKATRQADSSPCFLIREGFRAVCNEQQYLSAEKVSTTVISSVERKHLRHREKKSFSARSISY